MISLMYCNDCHYFRKGMDHGESGMGTCLKLKRTITWQQWCILKEVGCASHSAASRPAPSQDTLTELDTTIWMLYEFCEWLCNHNCEDKPCIVTVSRLHERLEGIQKQMKEHPEYLEEWNAKRAEQKSLRTGGDE